jgi:hypothetical protein
VSGVPIPKAASPPLAGRLMQEGRLSLGKLAAGERHSKESMGPGLWLILRRRNTLPIAWRACCRGDSFRSTTAGRLSRQAQEGDLIPDHIGEPPGYNCGLHGLMLLHCPRPTPTGPTEAEAEQVAEVLRGHCHDEASLRIAGMLDGRRTRAAEVEGLERLTQDRALPGGVFTSLQRPDAGPLHA